VLAKPALIWHQASDPDDLSGTVWSVWSNEDWRDTIVRRPTSLEGVETADMLV
jgi:hypothetical protein